MEKFSTEVSTMLGHYVYRLIDPRNGQTFYVGKGQGNRVFEHVKNAIRPSENESEATLKRDIIRDIRNSALEPIHVIHRHRIPDDKTARLIEATLMDAFPGLTNQVRGDGSVDYGPATAEQLEERYMPKGIPEDQPLVIIKIMPHSIERAQLALVVSRTHSLSDDDIYYQAVRAKWPIGVRMFEKLSSTPHHVLAMRNGICVGVYRPHRWYKSPPPSHGKRQRYEFDGERAAETIRDFYLGMRETKKGPFTYRYVGFDQVTESMRQ